jgi:hypothetical protein
VLTADMKGIELERRLLSSENILTLEFMSVVFASSSYFSRMKKGESRGGNYETLEP